MISFLCYFREKDYLKAKQEKKEYIENILSSRIKNYSIVKDRNKMLAGLSKYLALVARACCSRVCLAACEVSISSLEGSDYFAPRAKR